MHGPPSILWIGNFHHESSLWDNGSMCVVYRRRGDYKLNFGEEKKKDPRLKKISKTRIWLTAIWRCFIMTQRNGTGSCHVDILTPHWSDVIIKEEGVCAHVCVPAYVCVCACMRVHAYTCVCVCMCVRSPEKQTSPRSFTSYLHCFSFLLSGLWVFFNFVCLVTQTVPLTSDSRKNPGA